jgi:arylsulfatase A-like enzyme
MQKLLNGRLRRHAGALGLLAFLPFAAAPTVDPAAPPRVTDHVVVVSIDGLRPDAIHEYEARTLRRLMGEGAYTLEAQTILPSKTLPSHTSMLTGVPPSVHGVLHNSEAVEEYGYVPVPTVFELAKQAGLTTAAFFSKSKFEHLQKPGTLDYTQAPKGLEKWMATQTVADVADYLEWERPNLLFVHIGEPDFAGHTVGWMSFVYGWAVRRADGAVGKIIESADKAFGPGNYTLIVTADHGGHRRDHGSDDPQDTTIPWIAWGKGVRPGTQLGPGVRTMDTAATVLWLLGVRTPESWTGKPVTAAFEAAPQTAAQAVH